MAYYIYKLVDPRTGEPFYIGKGKGNRIDAHEKEARRGVHSRKCHQIHDIWRSGHQVKKEVIQRYRLETEAYAAEKALIEQIGLNRLTNVYPGGIYFKDRKVIQKVIDSRITEKELRKFVPTMAQTLKLISTGARIMLGSIDMTDAFKKFIGRLVKDFGKQKIVDAVLPYGVDLHISGA